MEMKPATMIAMVFLIAVIFVPAMFIDVKGIEESIPPDANGLTPPPIGPIAPPPQAEDAPPANAAPGQD
jgi:hypothetical protein